MNPHIPLKNHLFSSDQLGVVITSDDIRRVAKLYEIELAKKNNEATLIELTQELKKQKRDDLLPTILIEIIDQAKSELESTAKHYPATLLSISDQLQKADSFIDHLRSDFEAE